MKYQVSIPYVCWVYVEVDADDEKEAEDLAFEEGDLSGYAGNGGMDKLIGTTSNRASVEIGDVLDCENISIMIEQVD